MGKAEEEGKEEDEKRERQKKSKGKKRKAEPTFLACITLAPLLLERDDLLAFGLLQHCGCHVCCLSSVCKNERMKERKSGQ